MIGFLVGIFLMICIYVLNYMIRGTLTEGRVLSKQYNLPLYGEIIKSASIHKDKGLDKIISRWELGKNAVEEKTVYRNVSALIAEQQTVDSILLVSTLSENSIRPVKESLDSHLQDKKIEVKGSFLTESDAITEAANAAAVIIVEEKGLSRNKDIEQMAETMMICQAKVTGAIVI